MNIKMREQRKIIESNSVQNHNENLSELQQPITTKLENVKEISQKIGPFFLHFQNQITEIVTVSDSLLQT